MTGDAMSRVVCACLVTTRPPASSRKSEHDSHTTPTLSAPAISQSMSSSSVSFPRSPSPTHSSSTVTRESFFGVSYDPTASYQVNPLSSHPPRTPRTSIVDSQSQSYTYGDASLYSSTISHAEDTQEKQEAPEYEDEEVAEDVEEFVSEDVIRKVKPLDVWREILKTSSGRDKAFVSMTIY